MEKSETETLKRLTKKLGIVIDWIAFFLKILAGILLILLVWVENKLVIYKLLLSDLILFVTLAVIYWACCYDRK